MRKLSTAKDVLKMSQKNTVDVPMTTAQIEHGKVKDDDSSPAKGFPGIIYGSQIIFRSSFVKRVSTTENYHFQVRELIEINNSRCFKTSYCKKKKCFKNK